MTRRTTKTLVVAGILGITSWAAHAAPQRICDLTAITSPSSTLYLEVSNNCAGSRSIAWSNLSSLLTPTSRTITCTAPLLCAGTTSHDLASDFTLSINASSLFNFATVTTSSGTSPVADAAQDTLTLTCTAPLVCTGSSAADSVTLSAATATTSAVGVVQLAANGGTTASQAVQASDSRVGGSTAAAAPILTLAADAVGSILLLSESSASISSSAGPSIALRSSRGSTASPTASQSGDFLAGVNGRGYGTTGFASTARAGIFMYAAETYSDSVQGSYLTFETTKIGGTTRTEKMRVADSGHIILTQAAVPTATCTGTGTSPSTPTVVGTDNAFVITMFTGSGTPGSTGTCTITFATAYTTNAPVLVCGLVDGATAWGNEATIRVSTESLTAPVLSWADNATNVLTALTVSTNYKIACVAFGK